MKVLYGIQGTGNGHISCAQALLPHLTRQAQVDVLISGNQCDIELGYPLKYQLSGLGFVFGKKGGIDYLKTFKGSRLKQLFADVQSLPVEEYDLVLSDFEPVTAWACKLKKIPCLSIGHQAAVLNAAVPQPAHTDALGRAVLAHYAPSKHALSFHYLPYHKNIYTAIIRQELRLMPVTNAGHVTVYLPAFGDKQIIRLLELFPEVDWQVFSKHSKESYRVGNVFIQPINSKSFLTSMASASAVLCGAGFQTTAEALFLKKKLMVVPMRGQIEQQCNAAALAALGVQVLKSLKPKRREEVAAWIKHDQHIDLYFPDNAAEVVRTILTHPLLKEASNEATPVVAYKPFRKKLITRIFNPR